MKDIINKLEEFDKKRNWDHYNKAKTDEEKINLLRREIVSMLGEFGEFANIVKKSGRKNILMKKELKEELTDTFIFLLKISKVLEMDLEKEFYKKMELNEKRFPEN